MRCFLATMALAALSLLSACGGGSTATSTPTNNGSNESGGTQATVQGVSTPSSVAVVTAR